MDNLIKQISHGVGKSKRRSITFAYGSGKRRTKSNIITFKRRNGCSIIASDESSDDDFWLVLWFHLIVHKNVCMWNCLPLSAHVIYTEFYQSNGCQKRKSEERQTWSDGCSPSYWSKFWTWLQYSVIGTVYLDQWSTNRVIVENLPACYTRQPRQAEASTQVRFM